jgi:HSP20 family protein
MTNIVMKRDNRFPTLFNTDMFNEIFADFEGNFDKFFGTSQVVPYDVVQNKDENGLVKSIDIRYALAGYDKDNICIEIEDDMLTLKVDKIEETENASKSYLHKGISRRRIEASYCISGYDKDAISSTFENGVLILNMPVLQKKSVQKIEIRTKGKE